jgi:hypothetical protein
VVDPGVIQRSLSSERDVRMETADRLNGMRKKVYGDNPSLIEKLLADRIEEGQALESGAGEEGSGEVGRAKEKGGPPG